MSQVRILSSRLDPRPAAAGLRRNQGSPFAKEVRMSPKKLLAFGGMVLSGLCYVYGTMIFWIGALRLAMPQVFSKPGNDPVIQALMVAGGLILIAIGWLLGRNMKELYKEG
jgi:hypothetical protein